MARQFEKGTDVIKKAAESKKSKGRYTPNIYWKDGDIKTIAWLTAGDEIPKVRLHKMVPVPDDKMKSGTRWETLLCKKDPSMIEDFGGVCELCDEVGHEATEQFVALAVELEPVKDGKKVTGLKVRYVTKPNKDGVDVDYPQWGIVIQSASNFFAYYGAYHEASGDIREVAWEIHREGGSRDTKYHPFIVMNGPNAVPLPDMSDFADDLPALEALLEEMGSEEAYARVAGVTSDDIPSFDDERTDDGTLPSGERATEFAKVREEVVGSY
jgi:hypothetical protein